MRYVVTGSAGFVGHHVATALLEDGHAVDGVDAFTDYYDPATKRAKAAQLACAPRYRNVEADLALADIDDVLAGADAVIHLAAQPGVGSSWAGGFPTYVERNVVASQRLFEAARRTGVPRLVLASSSSVYGDAVVHPTVEDAPTRPFSPYGVTKLAMEQLATAYADNWGLPVVILRYFTVYGPGQRPDMALHRFIAAVAAGEPVSLHGDGEQVRDFTYVADAVAATIAAAAADVPPATVLNVAGGSSSTVNDLLGLVSEHVGRPVLTHHVAARPGDVRITAGAIERAHRVLGWRPEMSLDEGVKRQVAHQLVHGPA
ncbi:MAG TPA: NAD-dependent epimerase/dehydratase family protein [Acidimicrobiales bacterium]|nr:NAD-dependent epimerase/dehydratase family protein [Acidimicrobiales bacterium]